MTLKVALDLAAELDLDLVEIASNANPPVVKILDYSKYRYAQEVKQRQQKRNQSNQDVKEVRFRLKVDQNDFNIKVNNAIKFLKAGDKVKAQIMFRGRENQYPELGVQLLEKVAEELSKYGNIISQPTHEGRNVTMLLQPIAKKAHTISEQHRSGKETKDKRAARQAARLLAKGLDASGKKLTKEQIKQQEKLLKENSESKNSQTSDINIEDSKVVKESTKSAKSELKNEKTSDEKGKGNA